MNHQGTKTQGKMVKKGNGLLISSCLGDFVVGFSGLDKSTLNDFE